MGDGASWGVLAMTGAALLEVDKLAFFAALPGWYLARLCVSVCERV